MEEDESPIPKTLFVNKAVIQTSETETEINEEDDQSNHCHLQNSTEECEFVNSLSSFDAVETNIKETAEEQFLFDHLSISKSESKTKGDKDSLAYNDTEMIEVKEEINEEECNLVEESNLMKSESDIQVDTNICSSNELLPIKVENDGRVFNPMKSEGIQSQETSSECREIKQERDKEDEDLPFVTFGHTTNDGSGGVTPQEVSTTEFNSRTQENLPKVCDGFYGAMSGQTVEGEGSNSEIEIICQRDLPSNSERKMEEDGSPFPETLFVNKAVIQTFRTTETEIEINEENDQSNHCHLQNSTEECEFVNSLSSFDAVETNIKETAEEQFLSDHLSISKSESKTKGDEDSLAYNDTEMIEVKEEINEEGCNLVEESNLMKSEGDIQVDTNIRASNELLPIKVENDGRVFNPMKSEGVQSQETSSECREIKQESNEEDEDLPFVTFGHTTNDGSGGVTPQEVSTTEFNSRTQENLPQVCDGFYGAMSGQTVESEGSNSEIEIICQRDLPSNSERKMEEDENPIPKTLFVNKAVIQTLRTSETETKINEEDDQSNHCHLQNSTEECEFVNSLPSFDAVETNIKEATEEQFLSDHLSISKSESKTKGDEDSLAYNDTEMIEVKEEINEEEFNLVEESNLMKSESDIQVDTNIRALNELLPIKVEYDGRVFNPMKSEGVESQETSSECREIIQERDEEDEDLPFVTFGHTTNDGSSGVTPQEVSTTEFNSRTQENLPQVCDGFYGAMSGQTVESEGSNSEIEIICQRDLPSNLERKMEDDESPIPKTLFVNKAVIQTLRTSETEIEIDEDDQSNHCHLQNSTEECEFVNSLPSFDAVETNIKETAEEQFLFDHLSISKSESKTKGDEDSLAYNDTEMIEVKEEINEEECNLVEESNLMKSASDIPVDTNSRASNDFLPIKVENDGRVFNPMKSEGVQSQETSSECREIKQERDEENEDLPFVTFGHTTNDGSSGFTPQEVSTTKFNSRTQENLPKVCDGFYGAMSGQTVEGEGSNSEIGMMPSYSRSQGERTGLEAAGHLNQSMGIQVGADSGKLSVYDTVFSDVNSLQKHLAESVCTVCGQVLKNISHLRDHMKKHKGENPGIDIGRKKAEKSYICGMCGKELRDKSDLKKHMRVHTGEKPFKCTVCDKAFKSLSNRTTHMKKMHMIEESFSFNEMQNTGEMPIIDDSVDEALPVSFGETPIVGNIDDEALPLSFNQRQQTGDKTGNGMEIRKKAFDCGICGKVFTDLKKHMRVHTGERPYNCTFCNKAFKSISNCAAHMKIHMKEKRDKKRKTMHVCSVCDRTFSRKVECEIHMRIHTGDRPFECNVCYRTFYRKSHLVRHSKIHETEKEEDKAYKCKICGKASRFQADLKKHMRVHTGEKPFKCTVCDKAFNDNSNCITHMRKHTGEIPITSNSDDEALLVRFNERGQTGEIPITYNSDDEALPVSFNQRGQTGEIPITGNSDDEALPVSFNQRGQTGEIPITGNSDDEALPVSFNERGQTGEIPVTGNSDDDALPVSFNERGQTGEIPITGNSDDEALPVSFNERGQTEERPGIDIERENGEEKPYMCGKAPTSNADLKKHMHIHTGEKTFHCTICNKAFTDKSNCKTHMKKHAREKHFRFNERRQTGEIPITGNIDDEALPLSFNQRKQTGKKTGNGMKRMEKAFVCGICGKASTRSTDLKKHMRIHTGEKPYQCTVCDKAFKSTSNYATHMKIHMKKNRFRRQTRDIPFTCNSDDDALPVRFAERGQTGEIPVTDTFEDEAMSISCDIKTERRMQSKERHYMCSVCNKAFYRKVEFEVHMRVHTGDRPFECNICNKTFYRKSHLVRHIKIHETEKNGEDKAYKCRVCGKASRFHADLKKHMRVHTGEKPFKCTVCDKAFTDNSNCITHMKKHTGEIPITSNFDDEAFPVSLIKHTEEMPGIEMERKNVEEKRYVCGICGKASTRSTDLKKHMRTHTGERPYQCTVCDKAFKSTSNYTAHMKTHMKKKRFRVNERRRSGDIRVTGNSDAEVLPVNFKERGQTGEIPVTGKLDDEAISVSCDIKTERRLQSKKRQYMCSVCNKAFPRKVDFEVHMRVHTGDKPFTCTVCNKTFYRKSHLVRHIKSHERVEDPTPKDELGNEMEVEEKASTSNVDLKKHMQVHTGEKTFKCSVCDKAFYREIVLMRHMNIHEEDKNLTLKGVPGSDMDSNIQICDSVDALPAKSGQSGPITCLPQEPNAKFYQHIFP